MLGATEEDVRLGLSPRWVGSLSLAAKLKDLDMEDCQIELSQIGRDLYEIFAQNPILPGVLLTENNQFRGLLSRRKFLEVISRQHGRELFLRRPIERLYALLMPEMLVLPAEMLIAEASQRCLCRPPDSVYEPMAVEFADQSYRLLDLQKLLIANAEIYKLAMQTLDRQNLALAQANEEIQQRTHQLDRANQEITALNQCLKAENLRMRTELDVARQIQLMVLPKPEELEIPGLQIAGFMEPAAEVGGDYYDVLHNDGVVTIGIGDVTGHGLESGIVMLMAQTAIRTLKEIRERDPVRFLSTLNRTIYQNVQRMNIDKSLTLSVLNYCQGRVSLSGQHEETLVVRADGAIERIDTMDLGFPIGLDDEITEFIHQILVDLQPGDGIVLYTDGITEAENPQGELYGIDRLCVVISQNWQRSATLVQQAIVEDVKQYIQDQKVFDDITLLVLKQL